MQERQHEGPFIPGGSSAGLSPWGPLHPPFMNVDFSRPSFHTGARTQHKHLKVKVLKPRCKLPASLVSTLCTGSDSRLPKGHLVVVSVEGTTVTDQRLAAPTNRVPRRSSGSAVTPILDPGSIRRFKLLRQRRIGIGWGPVCICDMWLYCSLGCACDLAAPGF